MYCIECGHANPENANFCGKCGRSTSIVVQEQAPVTTESLGKSESNDLNLQTRPSLPRPKKKTILLTSIVIVAIVASSLAVNALTAPSIFLKSLPKLTSVFDQAKIDSTTKEMCPVIKESLTKIDVSSLNQFATALSSFTDARKAAKFQYGEKYSALDDATTVSTSAGDEITSLLSSSLENLVYKDSRIADKDRPEIVSAWESEWTSAVADSCGFAQDLASKTSAIVALSDATDSFETLAASAPWYPSGYNAWSEDENVAWKWVRKSCSGYDSWCWHVKVVTNSGCQDGLYVELNILDSNDNVVDYTNDSIPRLDAGGSAVLELSTYSNSGSSGRIATIDCHNY